MSWTIDPTKFGDQVVEDHRRLCVAVALAIDRRLVLGSPVGNPDLWKHPAPKGYVGGRFRSNWLPSINAPRTDQAPISDAAAVEGEAQEVFSAAPEFPLLFLSNNMPYATALQYGSSTQAPSGWIETAIDATIEAASRGRTGESL